MAFFRRYCFVIFVLTIKLSFAQEIYDVEVLPTFRTKQYLLKSPQKLIVFSAPRTGSSLVYNVFRFLFEADSQLFSYHFGYNPERIVLKFHEISELDLLANENTTVLLIYRNPLDASISYSRILSSVEVDSCDLAKRLVNLYCKYLRLSESLAQRGYKVIKLKLENFADDLSYLFNLIEEHFQIAIDPRDKELMKKGFSKENVSLCTSHLADFNECLPFSGFHGAHIAPQNYEVPKDLIYWLNFYIEKNREYLHTYGY